MAFRNAKNLWRRSVRLGKSDIPHIMGQEIPGTEPITLAIIGCGQRGKVCLKAPYNLEEDHSTPSVVLGLCRIRPVGTDQMQGRCYCRATAKDPPELCTNTLGRQDLGVQHMAGASRGFRRDYQDRW